jgi:N-acetylmuramoyl-L-alanine amidase
MGCSPVRKRIRTIFLILSLLFLSGGYNIHAEEPYKIRTVVIDAGHGGKDPGALGKKSREKDIVLAIALKLGKYIEDNMPEVKVIYTRKTDEFVELDRRAEIANENKADLFISIHANSMKNPNAYGAETYAMGLHTNEKNLEVAMKENAVITYEDNYTSKYAGYDPNSSESFIIFSFLQNTQLEQSLRFASDVQDQFRERAMRIDRGVRQAGFIVLWRTTMPSVLIETGYISNREEEAFLMTTNGQDLLASAIFRAFREYKTSMENRGQLAVSQEQMNNHPTVMDTGIRFKVQVTSSANPIPLPSDLFKGFDQVEEFVVDGKYKYAVGNDTSYQEIVTFSQTVKKTFPDAFVIAVKNNQIIPLAEALKETGNK